ncbi:Transposase [Alkalicoccus chagannorensis]
MIAQLVKDGRYSVPNLLESVYAELRQGMTIHGWLTERLNRTKAKVHNWLDRYFPEFTDVFKSWEGQAALQVLSWKPLPYELAGMNDDTILHEIKQGASRGVGPARVRDLKEAAGTSMGIRTGARMAERELYLLLQEYHQLVQDIQRLEEELTELIQPIPGVEQMLAIKGIGPITVAGFFAEVGDLTNYEDPRQIIKLAGLNLRRNESGTYKGQTQVSKRGRRKLRALLFRVALPLSSRNEAFRKLHHYFRQRPENPLTGKQSLIALCCKLIRILFVIGKKQCAFDEQRMLRDMPQFNHVKQAV